jgi:hypothetical protein
MAPDSAFRVSRNLKMVLGHPGRTSWALAGPAGGEALDGNNQLPV